MSDQLGKQILSGVVRALSQGITLVESTRPEHRDEALSLLEMLGNKGAASCRLAITGPPGVGKSTFIERLGLHAVAQGKKVAVLAVDPSSARGHGSILGDKTRMENLVKSPNVFVRPSPAGRSLGGVALGTRNAMVLCEAAGFDFIIVETVGVGQSETAAASLTDTFLLLAMPALGDELQGIKRGIMEMAHVMLVNKADGALADVAEKTRQQLKNVLSLLPPHADGWRTSVVKGSALLGDGIAACYDTVMARHAHLETTQQLKPLRWAQCAEAVEQRWQWEVLQRAWNSESSAKLSDLKKRVAEGACSEFEAARILNALSGHT